MFIQEVCIRHMRTSIHYAHTEMHMTGDDDDNDVMTNSGRTKRNLVCTGHIRAYHSTCTGGQLLVERYDI